MTRIDQATNHLPSGIDSEMIKKLKYEIEKRKKPVKVENNLGERIIFKRKLYHLNELIKILQKYELFGEKEHIIYSQLQKFGEMRNRVHIENYFNNFEDDEYKVFTSQRLTTLEEILSNLWEKMLIDYKRPWGK